MTECCGYCRHWFQYNELKYELFESLANVPAEGKIIKKTWNETVTIKYSNTDAKVDGYGNTVINYTIPSEFGECRIGSVRRPVLDRTLPKNLIGDGNMQQVHDGYLLKWPVIKANGYCSRFKQKS